jgi:hypothetical protein
MARGFSVNTTSPVALSTSFVGVAVDGNGGSVIDAKALALPQACRISNAAFSLTDVTSATHCHAYLAWDSAGLYPINQPVQVDLFATATGSRHVGAMPVQELDVRAPSVQTTVGTIYLMIRLNSGTANLRWAAVQWVDGNYA